MSASRGPLRRRGATNAVVVTAVVVVAVTAAGLSGSRIPASRSLPALARGASDRYASNAIGGHLAPVDAGFIASRVGRVPGVGAPGTTPAAATRRSTTVSAPPQQSIAGAPGAIPGFAPGGWELTLQMATDGATVHSGDEIRYRMTIANVGHDDFRGRAFLLEWHTPSGTFGRNALEQCAVLPVGVVQAMCSLQRLHLSPGFGEASHERFNSSGLIVISPGEEWTHDWYVQVLPSNAAGSTIVNHAHLNVHIDGRPLWIRTPDVVVTVAA